MKNIKKLILIVCITIAVIIVSIITLKIIKKVKKEEANLIGDPGEDVTYSSNEMEDVTDKIKFYTVRNCINTYLDQINNNNSSFYGMNENNEYVKILEQAEINQSICDLLSEEYLNENKITESNIENNIEKLEEKVFFIPLKMKVQKDSIINKYIVYGFIENTKNEFIKELYIIVNLDLSNKTFSIEPVNKQYKSIEEIRTKNTNKPIEKNNYNQYMEEMVNYDYSAKDYVQTYKNMILGAPRIAYEYLDKEYKEKRFGNVTEFEKYVQDNRKELATITCSKYKVDSKDGVTEFICLDQNQNMYIFKEINVMDFSIKLDTYTILNEKFEKTYENSNEPKRAMMNADKWVQMLNNRDYNAAYLVLDEEFRNTKFGSKERFEQYMREMYPLHYKIEFSNYSEENGTYIQNIILTDITNETEESKNMTIIIKLKEGTDFVMSFDVK